MEAKRIYCIGNCKDLSVEDACEWRDSVDDFFVDNEKYNCNVKVFNICGYYNYERKIHKTEKEIADFCIRNVKNSDAVIVNADLLDKSIGSHCEITTAMLSRIPIFIFAENYENIYPWFVEWAERIECGDGALKRICQHVNDYIIGV